MIGDCYNNLPQKPICPPPCTSEPQINSNDVLDHSIIRDQSLCKTCQDIFYSYRLLGDGTKNSTRYTHLDDALMLEKQAKEGCRFCLFLWEMLSENEKIQVLTQTPLVSIDPKVISYEPTEETSYPFPTEYYLAKGYDGVYKLQYTFKRKASEYDVHTVEKCVSLSPASGKLKISNYPHGHDLTGRSHRAFAFRN